jgi:hypothetical protein
VRHEQENIDMNCKVVVPIFSRVFNKRYSDHLSSSFQYINTNYPQYQGLFFVEGVQQNFATPNTNPPNAFWGEDLEGVYWNPINTGKCRL